MDDLGDSRALQFVKAFPNRAQPLAFQVVEDHGNHIGLARWHVLPGECGEPLQFVRGHAFERLTEAGCFLWSHNSPRHFPIRRVTGVPPERILR